MTIITTEHGLADTQDPEMESLCRSLRLSPLMDVYRSLMSDPRAGNGEISYREFTIALLKGLADTRATKKINVNIEALDLRYPNARLVGGQMLVKRDNLSQRAATELAACDWARMHRSIVLMGPTGTGKTWLSDAMAVAAINHGLKVWARRFAELSSELSSISTGDFVRLRKLLSKRDVIYIDAFASCKLPELAAERLLEIADRCTGVGNRGCFLITTQQPFSNWYQAFPRQEMAESFVDRLKADYTRLELKGESLRAQPSRPLDGKSPQEPKEVRK